MRNANNETRVEVHMKHVFVGLMSMMFLEAGILLGQPNPLRYFPLDSGNVWQYHVTILNPEPPDSTYYMTVRLSGDTLLPNGKHYKMLDKLELARYYRLFVRIDSAALAVRAYQPFNPCSDSEVVLFRLSLDSLGYHDCHGVLISSDTGHSQVGLIQRNARFQDYRWFDGFSNHYVLHEDIGLSFFRQWELAGWQGILVAARINGVQYGNFVGVHVQPTKTSSGFMLDQNYPNPFNPTTTITYSLPLLRGGSGWGQHVTLKVFDVFGREVASLVNEEKMPGLYEVTWDAHDFASGIYFYRLNAGSFTSVKRMLLIK
ncbi:MAG: peptidase and subtilisin kexin sedolisin [Bacteroidetes bacterium]|nr:peptidase and subtilisin kexin sedolisin [Bacteroidota bacterium]